MIAAMAARSHASRKRAERAVCARVAISADYYLVRGCVPFEHDLVAYAVAVLVELDPFLLRESPHHDLDV